MIKKFNIITITVMTIFIVAGCSNPPPPVKKEQPMPRCSKDTVHIPK